MYILLIRLFVRRLRLYIAHIPLGKSRVLVLGKEKQKKGALVALYLEFQKIKKKKKRNYQRGF